MRAARARYHFCIERISVLLVDDHALVRRGLRRLLEDDLAITVVGEAGSADDAVRLVEALNPRVIVMDCAMPGTNGLVATRRIVERRPDALVLMLSMHNEETLVRQAIAAGVRGYLLKEAVGLDLAQAVKQVAAGQAVFDPKVSSALSPRGPRTQGLSDRQLEVLQLICEGLSSRAIADRLGLSVNTVAVHRANIMKTLGIRGAAELVAYAIRSGLVNPF